MFFLCRICRGAWLRQRTSALFPKLYTIAFAWSSDCALAQRLAETAVERVWAADDLIKHPRELQPRLYRALVGVCSEHMPLVDSETRLVISKLNDDSEQNAVQARVSAAVAALDDHDRLMLLLVDLGNCSYAQAAAAMGVSVGRLLTGLCRARASLQHEFGSGVQSAADHGAQTFPWRAGR